MAGPTQHRYVLHVGLGIILFASLGLMAEPWQNMFAKLWHIPGAANVMQRQLRSTDDALFGVLVEEPSTGTKLVSAMMPSRCAYFPSEPKKGLIPQIGECSQGQPTRFQLPEGTRGPIKLATDPSLCLDAPGGHLLQLWSCDADSKHLDFTLHPEPPGWIGVPHYDLADKADAENMDASDIKAVAKRAEELGYEGFSVFKGRAFLKKVNHALFEKDLEYMGTDDPCVFYLRRPEHSDVSIRLAAQPDRCLHAPPSDGPSNMGMAPCEGTDQSVNGGAWSAGMVFRVEGGAKPSPETTPKPAPAPAVTPSPTPAPVVEVTPSPTPAPVVEEGGEEVTNKEEPADDTGSMSRLIIVLNVKNVDYEKLSTNEPLTTKFKNVIQEDVATMAGLGHENVDVELGPGSVNAINTLMVPETSKAEDVRSKLQLDTLSEKVASNLKSVEGIDEVSTGDISVAGSEETGQANNAGGIPHLPLVILLGVLVILTILVVVIVIMVRSKSQRNVGSAKKATEHPREDDSEDQYRRENPMQEGLPESPSEHDRLLVSDVNGNEDSGVLTEEQELQGELAGPPEEETPLGEDSHPPAATVTSQLNEALDTLAAPAPADDEDAELRAVLEASKHDTGAGQAWPQQHDTGEGTDGGYNPFAEADPHPQPSAQSQHVPGANTSAY